MSWIAELAEMLEWYVCEEGADFPLNLTPPIGGHFEGT